MAEPLRVSEVISAALYGDGERREVPEVARLASLVCGDPIARKPEAKPDACCAPVEQEACCEPSAKADCCGSGKWLGLRLPLMGRAAVRGMHRCPAGTG